MNVVVGAGRVACARPFLLILLIGLAAACAGPAFTLPAQTLAPSPGAGSSPALAASEAPTFSPSSALGPSEPPPSAGSSPTPAASAAPVLSPSPTASASCAQRVLVGMTTAQRIGQLFLLGLADNRLGAVERAAIRDDHIGSVWFTAQTSIGVAGIRAVSDAVQAQVGVASTAGVGFFVAANQEGGLIQALAGAGFSTIPTPVVQGSRPPDVLAAQAAAWGAQLREAGINLDFAPVADVVPPGGDASNEPIGVLQREYGHDPLTAGDHAAAFIAGMADAGVATTAKHFPGLGRVVGNTDVTAGVVDTVTTADDPDLASFRAAIAAGVPFVMVALATFTRIDPAHLAAFSPRVIGDLLRDDLGFRGVVMSDDIGETAAVATMPPGERALEFLLAGGDLIVSRSAAATAAMVAELRGRAATDPAVAARVDDAALRVLGAKEAAGLLPCRG